jgi:hypothetical protein
MTFIGQSQAAVLALGDRRCAVSAAYAITADGYNPSCLNVQVELRLRKLIYKG